MRDCGLGDRGSGKWEVEKKRRGGRGGVEVSLTVTIGCINTLECTHYDCKVSSRSIFIQEAE